MTGQHSPSHLSRISTIWENVAQAQCGESAEMNLAQGAIIERYAGAVHRYLWKVLRDPDAADDVFQEFALLVLQGGFRHASQQRGRFRDYLETAVLRLVGQYRRRRKRRDPLLHATPLATPRVNRDRGGPPANPSLRRAGRRTTSTTPSVKAAAKNSSTAPGWPSNRSKTQGASRSTPC